MSQNVEKLKALLFDEETQARHSLERKIETVALQDSRAREELRQKVEQVFDRAGTRESLATSVAEVLDDALRQAEVAQHEDLSRTIAPLVVTTIKTELRNSQDEMVEALYPITGRLVKSYVASAMKDLTEQMNRRLEQNPVMLRLQSLATGRSVTELALAGTQDFAFHELYLIRRGTGDLVAHWPDVSPTKSHQSLSGVLAAINEFANEALSASQESMRQIDLGEELVYLRGSPLYLLAARCTGSAPPNIEQILDDGFLEAIDHQNLMAQSDAPTGPSNAAAAAMRELGEELSSKVSANLEAQKNSIGQASPLKYLAAIVLLPLLTYLAWTWYGQFSEDRVRSTALRVVESVPEMRGYPAELDIGRRGKRLIISGLAPSQAAKTQVIRLLSTELANTNILDQLTVVAGADIKPVDLMPEINKVRSQFSAIETNLALRDQTSKLDHSREQLQAAARDLKQASADAKNAQLAARVKKVATQLDALLADTKLETIGGETDAQKTPLTINFGPLAERVEAIHLELLPALNADQSKRLPANDQRDGDAFDRFVSAADRISSLAAAASIAAAYSPAPVPPPLPPKEPTPREKISDYIQSKAVFFSNDLEYRNPQAAMRISDELAVLIKNSGTFLRIVGYTDDAGIQAQNINLAQQRADKVRTELLTRGVPASSLGAVGRSDARDISSSRGADSPNRRVEFELGFDGESLP